MNYEKGQSLIELLVALSVFVLAVSAITFLIIDSYISNQVGEERTLAVFLAEEGLEAALAIRNNDWGDLTLGDHGLATSGGSWVFQGELDTIDKFTRVITVSDVSFNRKEVTSQVNWQLTETRFQNVSLTTYLTNWKKN